MTVITYLRVQGKHYGSNLRFLVLPGFGKLLATTIPATSPVNTNPITAFRLWRMSPCLWLRASIRASLLGTVFTSTVASARRAMPKFRRCPPPLDSHPAESDFAWATSTVTAYTKHSRPRALYCGFEFNAVCAGCAGSQAGRASFSRDEEITIDTGSRNAQRRCAIVL